MTHDIFQSQCFNQSCMCIYIYNYIIIYIYIVLETVILHYLTTNTLVSLGFSIIFPGFFVAPFLSSVTAWHQRPSLGSPGVQLDPQALGAPFLQDLLPLLDLGLASSAAAKRRGRDENFMVNQWTKHPGD